MTTANIISAGTDTYAISHCDAPRKAKPHFCWEHMAWVWLWENTGQSYRMKSLPRTGETGKRQRAVLHTGKDWEDMATKFNSIFLYIILGPKRERDIARTFGEIWRGGMDWAVGFVSMFISWLVIQLLPCLPIFPSFPFSYSPRIEMSTFEEVGQEEG